MKFILFNTMPDIKGIKEIKYEVVKDRYIKEINISKERLNKVANLALKTNKKFWDKITVSIFEFILVRSIKDYDVKYILSNNFIPDKTTKYFINLLEKMKLGKLDSLNEMNKNICKYIDEYIEANETKAENIKILFVYKDENSIDINSIKEANDKYKKVDIYLKSSPTKSILNKIENINDAEGSIIEIIKYNKKAFVDYNIIYYVDDNRISYPRMRLNKKSLIIDLETSLNDKFNSNIIIFNKLENKTDKIECLKERYGLLNIAHVVSQM